MDKDKAKKVVKEGYGRIARERTSCCAPSSSCCGSPSAGISHPSDIKASVLAEADLGLGCGNPIALASLKPGETVLDLGSGTGFDCFLAAERVGKKGKVIGVDMTPRLTVLKVEEPPKRQAGVKVGSVQELVAKLRNEAKVI